MYFGCCHIQHHIQTIHSTEIFISMNLLQMSCVITWAWSFLTSESWRLLEAKNIISWCTLWHFNSRFGSSHSDSSAYQRFNQKWDQLWLSVHSAYISRILEPRPQGLISSVLIIVSQQKISISFVSSFENILRLWLENNYVFAKCFSWNSNLKRCLLDRLWKTVVQRKK